MFSARRAPGRPSCWSCSVARPASVRRGSATARSPMLNGVRRRLMPPVTPTRLRRLGAPRILARCMSANPRRPDSAGSPLARARRTWPPARMGSKAPDPRPTQSAGAYSTRNVALPAAPICTAPSLRRVAEPRPRRRARFSPRTSPWGRAPGSARCVWSRDTRRGHSARAHGRSPTACSRPTRPGAGTCCSR